MLPEINHKILSILWKIKETLWTTLFPYILMSFQSSSPKIDCINRYITLKLWVSSFFDFIIASMLPEIMHWYFLIYGKFKETPWKTLFSVILMTFHSSNSPKQIAWMNTSHLNCEKTVPFTFIIASLCPEIIHKLHFNICNFQEILQNSKLSSFDDLPLKLTINRLKSENTISKL